MIQLSKKEEQILHFISNDYSNQEIASKLNISHSLVNRYRRSLIWKLNSKNSIGAVKKAFENGILPINFTNQLSW